MRTWQFGQEILDPSYLEYDPEKDTWAPGEFKSLPNRHWGYTATYGPGPG